MRYAWLTDIHLEFLRDKKAVAFIDELATLGIDGLFLTDDISTAGRFEFHLRLFENGYQAPVYFVLGNHDYYGGSIESVRRMIRELCGRSKWLHWLPVSGIVEISSNTCLLGHGWKPKDYISAGKIIY